MANFMDPSNNTPPITAPVSPVAPADTNTVAPVAPVAPTSAAAVAPSPAPQPKAPATPSTAQPGVNSNAPDAQTPAAKSIPAALINNPAVPTQKMATDADLAKNSPAPKHSWLYQAALALTGGPRTQTTYDQYGDVKRVPVDIKPWQVGMALAVEALNGGLAGMTAKGPNAIGEAGVRGMEVGEKAKAAVQKANTDQDAQAKADQGHKIAVTEANMRNYMTSVNAGKSSLAASQAFGDSFKNLAGFADGTIPLPPGVTKSDPQWESDATAAVANGKTNVTHDFLFPIGDPKPILGKDGQQLILNGVPQVGHDFITLHGVGPDAKIPLTSAMQKSFVDAGLMTEPKGQIGSPQWPLSDIAKKSAQLAAINTGEQMLQDHKDDAHDLLGRKQEDLGDLKAEVKANPAMQKAVSLFAQAQAGTKDGSGHIDEILNAMGTIDPASRGLLMNYLHLHEQDLDDMHNKRVEATTEANTKTPQEKALTPVEIEDKKADVALKLSGVSKNKAEAAKANADIKKLLADASNNDAVVDAMGTGHVSAERMAYILSRNPSLVAAVTAKYHDFDSSKAEAYPKAYADYVSQKRGTTGGAINAGATAFTHLENLLKLNTNASHIPGTPAYNAYKNQMDTLVSELGQFYGNTTIPGLDDFKDTLDATLPGNREAAIRTQAHSMAQKMNEYEHGWQNAAPSAFYQAPIPWMDSEALHARAFLDPSFKTRVPEGAVGRAKIAGTPYWVNKQMKPLQEVVQ